MVLKISENRITLHDDDDDDADGDDGDGDGDDDDLMIWWFDELGTKMTRL